MSTPPAELEIVDLDPFDDAAFAAWHGVYLRAQHALGAAATPWQLEELRAIMQHSGSAAWVGGWSAVVDDEVVGAGFIRTPLLDNLELAELDVHVAPDRQRRGIGAALLAHAEAAARRLGRTVVTGLVGWSWDAGPDGDGEAGPLFARACGYELALTEVQRELALPVADSVLVSLADEAALAHPTYELRSWEGPVPEDLLQGWAGLTSSLATEAPTGELDLEPEVVSTEVVREREATIARQGRTKYNTVALSASGELVAYSDLATTVHEPGRAYQWGTLVVREHRGHRLGVAVKVANLRLLQASRPDIARLTTYNAEVNTHMVGVNEAMGFQPVGRLGDFQKRLTEPSLVRVGPDEWEVFRDVRLASLAEAPAAFGATYADWVDAAEDRWRSRLADVPFTVVASVDGRGVGVVSGAPSESEVWLISMWVAPDHRGTGLAARLIEEVASWASARGHDTYLMVRDDNDRAIRAYERAGFTDLGVPDDWPDDALRERRMRRARA